MAAVLNLPALTQRHETVSGSSLPITCGAEAWKIVHLHQPSYNFIQGTIVDYVKLLRLGILRLRLTIAAHAGL